MKRISVQDALDQPGGRKEVFNSISEQSMDALLKKCLQVRLQHLQHLHSPPDFDKVVSLRMTELTGATMSPTLSLHQTGRPFCVVPLPPQEMH